MKTLRKLFYVACTTFFLTSCEETYNDKLFWPGELSQEYQTIHSGSDLQRRKVNRKNRQLSDRRQ